MVSQVGEFFSNLIDQSKVDDILLDNEKLTEEVEDLKLRYGFEVPETFYVERKSNPAPAPSSKKPEIVYAKHPTLNPGACSRVGEPIRNDWRVIREKFNEPSFVESSGRERPSKLVTPVEHPLMTEQKPLRGAESYRILLFILIFILVCCVIGAFVMINI